MHGKAMLVCMSRQICVDLYNELVKLRPDWTSAPDDDIEAEKKQSTVVKIVMTGSADDGADWQPHIRSKLRRKALAKRFKDIPALAGRIGSPAKIPTCLSRGGLSHVDTPLGRLSLRSPSPRVKFRPLPLRGQSESVPGGG